MKGIQQDVTYFRKTSELQPFLYDYARYTARSYIVQEVLQIDDPYINALLVQVLFHRDVACPHILYMYIH